VGGHSHHPAEAGALSRVETWRPLEERPQRRLDGAGWRDAPGPECSTRVAGCWMYGQCSGLASRMHSISWRLSFGWRGRDQRQESRPARLKQLSGHRRLRYIEQGAAEPLATSTTLSGEDVAAGTNRVSIQGWRWLSGPSCPLQRFAGRLLQAYLAWAIANSGACAPLASVSHIHLIPRRR
jgi:hypothetical protein